MSVPQSPSEPSLEPPRPAPGTRPQEEAANPVPGAPGGTPFIVLFTAVLLPMFLAAVDQTLLAVATPEIGREFGDMNRVSWLAVAYLLASVVLVPLYGRLADRYGRRQLLGVALCVFTVGSVACSLAPTIQWLIAARTLQGAGGAGMMSLSHALIGEVLRPRERARYQGYFSVLFATASLIGPLLGGVVVQMGDWRWLFVANLPLCALAGWRLARLSHVPPPLDRRGRLDFPGGVLFALTAALTMWLLSRTGGITLLSGWLVWGVPLLALCLWLLLWRVGMRTAHPYLPLDLLRLSVMRHSAIATLTYAAAMFSLVFYLPAYVQAAFGSSASESGVMLLPVTGGTILGSILAGRIVMQTGRTREPPMGGLILATISLVLLALLPPSRIAVLICGAGAGLGMGMVMSVTQIITQVAAGPQRLGAAAAVVSLSRNLGAATGAAAFGAISLSVASAAWLPGQLAGNVAGYHVAYLAAGVACALGAWSASRLPRDRLPGDSHPPGKPA
ncbi:MAG TPA: MDR family MFS transporter [Burkholderiaceae bacterium]|nr:MDR family MFS transporter [Burkholderiaceae bacterium]